MLQRQSLINQLYSSGESIIEKSISSHSSIPSSFTLTSSPGSSTGAFQQWLASASIASTTTETETAAAKEAINSPTQNKYDEGKPPAYTTGLGEN